MVGISSVWYKYDTLPSSYHWQTLEWGWLDRHRPHIVVLVANNKRRDTRIVLNKQEFCVCRTSLVEWWVLLHQKAVRVSEEVRWCCAQDVKYYSSCALDSDRGGHPVQYETVLAEAED